MGRDAIAEYTREVDALIDGLGGFAVAGAVVGVSGDAAREWRRKGALRQAHLDELRDAGGEREPAGCVNAALRVALTSLHALQRARVLLVDAGAGTAAVDEYDALARHVEQGRDRLLRLVDPTKTTN